MRRSATCTGCCGRARSHDPRDGARCADGPANRPGLLAAISRQDSPDLYGALGASLARRREAEAQAEVSEGEAELFRMRRAAARGWRRVKP